MDGIKGLMWPRGVPSTAPLNFFYFLYESATSCTVIRRGTKFKSVTAALSTHALISRVRVNCFNPNEGIHPYPSLATRLTLIHVQISQHCNRLTIFWRRDEKRWRHHVVGNAYDSGSDVDGKDGDFGSLQTAERCSAGRIADADVAKHSESYCQPDGDRMAEHRKVDVKHHESITDISGIVNLK